MSSRRNARACAIQMLYPLSLGPGEPVAFDVEQVIRDFWAHFEAPADAKPYADALARGVIAHLAGIDEALAQASAHWRLDRMAKVDLTILRVAAYEMLFEGGVPHEVVIDEALELTKRFSTAEATGFINGVLAPLVGKRQKP